MLLSLVCCCVCATVSHKLLGLTHVYAPLGNQLHKVDFHNGWICEGVFVWIPIIVELGIVCTYMDSRNCWIWEYLQEFQEAHSELVASSNHGIWSLGAPKLATNSWYLQEFQEAHARQLTRDMKYEWAFDNYQHAKELYSGQTRHVCTEFAPHKEKLSHLHRGFVVKKYSKHFEGKTKIQLCSDFMTISANMKECTKAL